MNADTTPAPRLDFICAEILPYHKYEVVASSVPEELSPSWERVKSTWSSKTFGVPLDTQLDFDASPRYSLFDMIPLSDES